MYLISKARCEEIQSPNADVPQTSPKPDISSPAVPEAEEDQGNATDGDQPTEEETDKEEGMVQLSMSGTLPPELWNRLGTKVVPKLRTSGSLTIGVDFKGEFDAAAAASIETELRVILSELELEGKFIVKRS